MTARLIIVVFVFAIFTLSACERNPLDVNIENNRVELPLKRFEQSLFQSKSDLENLDNWQREFPQFFTVFTQDIVPLQGVDENETMRNINHFKSDKDIQFIFEKSQELYEDFAFHHQSINKAFSYLDYHFPEIKKPELITFISGFNYGMVALDSSLAIGLDMYLGKEFEFYELLRYPEFKRRKLTQERLATDAIYAWISTEFEPPVRGSDFLSLMIYEGKLLYLMNAFFPQTHDSTLIAYSNEQWQWALANEYNAWVYIVKEELLYSKDYAISSKFLNEAPFTSVFGRESAPRMGQFIGWRMVKKFMENKDLTLSQLMKIEDARSILAQSNYKPIR